jgi:hypothetical protein
MARERVFFLIMFGIFVLLAFYIAASVIQIYRSSKNQTSSTMPFVKCSALLFEVDKTTIKLQNGNLSFEVSNTYGDKIDALTIGYYDEKNNEKNYEFKFLDFYNGKKKKIVIYNFNHEGEFYVYPSGCPQNKKIYETKSSK